MTKRYPEITMPTMWMVRGDAGRLYEEFRASGVVALGMEAWAAQARKGMSRDQLKDLYIAADNIITKVTMLIASTIISTRRCRASKARISMVPLQQESLISVLPFLVPSRGGQDAA